MQRYEYKVIPAPDKGEKAKGVKRGPDRFAYRLSRTLNELAREGWEYLRADTLPCEERIGLTGKTVTYQNMLVFRRAVAGALPIFDDTMIPGAMPTGGSAFGALMAGRVGQAQESPAPEDDAIAEDETESDAPPAQERPANDAAVLSARAPKGKAPRITAFDRLADASGKDSPEPEEKIAKS
jgi:hypothetical protein